jgi:hypothetical protein
MTLRDEIIKMMPCCGNYRVHIQRDVENAGG